MTRKKAQDEIMLRLDEIQQILDLLDPEREARFFFAEIVRRKTETRIRFELDDTDGRAMLLYNE